MSKVAKAAVGLMAATLVAKILGFGRELALASAYGASGVSDAFLVAMNIPAVIFTAIGTSLGTAFIPLYCDVNAKEGQEASIKFTNNVFNIVVIICLLLSAIGSVFTPQIVKIFAIQRQRTRSKSHICGRYYTCLMTKSHPQTSMIIL